MSYTTWVAENIDECRYLFQRVCEIVRTKGIVWNDHETEESLFKEFTRYMYRVSNNT